MGSDATDCEAAQLSPIARPYEAGHRHTQKNLHFLDLNDGLAFIGAAVQAGVMGQLQFMALGTDRHAWRCHPQLLRPALIASGSRMFMFRIGHSSSSKQRLPASPWLVRPADLVFRAPDHPDRRCRRFSRALTGPFVQIFPAARAQAGTFFTAERPHRRRQNDVFAQHRS